MAVTPLGVIVWAVVAVALCSFSLSKDGGWGGILSLVLLAMYAVYALGFATLPWRRATPPAAQNNVPVKENAQDETPEF